mgnify:CR=1 FL=1
MAEAKIEGLSEALAAVRKMVANVTAAGEDATRDTAEDTAKAMRSRAPSDTGRLRSRIGVSRTGPGEYAAGVEGVDYAAFVEFGTSKDPAQPFVTPAGESARARLTGNVSAAVKRAAR